MDSLTGSRVLPWRCFALRGLLLTSLLVAGMFRAACAVGLVGWTVSCGEEVQEVAPDGSDATSTTTVSTTSDSPTQPSGSGPTPDPDATGSTGADPTASSTTTDPTLGTTTASVDCGADWWDSLWPSRLSLNIPARNIPANLSEVPVLVVVDDARVEGSTILENELRFVGDSGTLRPHEVERWTLPGASYVWVRLTQVSAKQDTRLWMYFGASQAPDARAPQDVWANYLAVYHFHDDFADAAQDHDGFGPDLPDLAPGFLGRSAQFNGTDHYIELSGKADFDLTNAMTISLWMRRSQWNHTYETLIAKGDDSWRLHRDNNGAVLQFANHIPNGGTNDLGGSTEVADDQWHHIAAVYSGTTKTLFVDGMIDAMTGYDQGLPSSSHPVYVGENSQANGRFFGGTMDELRISGIPRSPEWIAVQVAAMRDELIEYGPVEHCR